MIFLALPDSMAQLVLEPVLHRISHRLGAPFFLSAIAYSVLHSLDLTPVSKTKPVAGPSGSMPSGSMLCGSMVWAKIGWGLRAWFWKAGV
jgi:hypothetical protein